MDPSIGIPLSEDFFHTFYQAKLPSFNISATNKTTLNNDDFSQLIQSHESYINEVMQITGKPYDQVLLEFAEYYQSKQFLIQPNRLSGVIHKLSNAAYVSSATVQPPFATASSHISGITGVSLLGSVSGLVIFFPLRGGVFFAAAERITADTPLQPACVLARYTCLLVLKGAKIAYNNVFVGPLLRQVGIDAPLNITSMLRFGSGTKVLMGGIVNARLALMCFNFIKLLL